ncbi:MAG: helix-turn-helix domain-containing protein [Deltaproteobacteria bacterium]|nr:helix-turn-helix domain-containing protein [Deltaproteobacteria bacterium]
MNKRLKAKIIERFGSQADFAQEIQVDESVISRVIRGRRVLSPEDRAKWCEVLGCDPSILAPLSK